MSYTVKRLAKIAGISVRTLHYYDEIGLLKPSFTKLNSYRVYEKKELLLLQQILFFRELQFPLEQIMQMVHAKDYNPEAALKAQRTLFDLEKNRLEALIQTIDKTIVSMKGGVTMNDDQLYGTLSKKQMEEYKDEARQRWGETDAWKQSQQRTKNWTKEDYKRVAEDGEAWIKRLAGLQASGLSVESPEIQTMIEQHYNGLRRFYEPNYEMYKGLGQMFVDDKRFSAQYDKYAPGLAVFMRDAMHHFVDVHTA